MEDNVRKIQNVFKKLFLFFFNGSPTIFRVSMSGSVFPFKMRAMKCLHFGGIGEMGTRLRGLVLVSTGKKCRLSLSHEIQTSNQK